MVWKHFELCNIDLPNKNCIQYKIFQLPANIANIIWIVGLNIHTAEEYN